MITITQTHLGRIGDDETIEEVEELCKFAGGDYAIELRGKTLHMFRVQVREVS